MRACGVMTTDRAKNSTEGANVENPIGATLPQEHPSGEDTEADPDLDRWQHDRWAPHPLKPETGQTRAERAREVRDRLRGGTADDVKPEPRPVEETDPAERRKAIKGAARRRKAAKRDS